MPVVALSNLTAGEVSPAFMGRADVARYPNACQRLENFLLTSTGMYSRRPGMAMMGFAKSNAAVEGRVRMRRFQFSDQSGNMLELGGGYARVWASAGQVVDPSSDQPVEVATPFTVADLAVLGFAQSADFLFVVNENTGIFTIKKNNATTWTFSSFPLTDGPYGEENAIQTQTLSFSAPAAGVTTISAAGFTADNQGGQPFLEGDEGRVVRIRDGTDAHGNPQWSWIILTAITSPTVAVGTIQSNGGSFYTLAAATPYYDWRLGLYSDRLGWPIAARIHEQRLVLAGPASSPDRVDGSGIAQFNVFAPTDPLVDDGAYAYALGTESVNRIVTMGSSNDLLLFTAGSEHHIAGDATGAAITPTAIWQKPISPDGAKTGLESIAAGNANAFVDKYGLNIRAVTFDVRFQNYAPDNLTEIADHMAWLDPNTPGFQALCWQANPLGTIWTIRGNNELAGAIYNPLQNVLGWHRHPMGVPTLDGATPASVAPVVESIDVMKGPLYDELWASVVRQLPGRTLRTIERMGRPGLWDTPYQAQNWLDCSLSLDNTPTADLVPGATTGAGVAFTVQNPTGGFVFQATDVGRFIKARYQKALPTDDLPGFTLRGRPRWATAVAQITAYVSPTQVTVTIPLDFPSTAAIPAGGWGLTVAAVSGLRHFEGLFVRAVSDGSVCRPVKVVNGAIPLDVPGWQVRVGLDYTAIMVGVPIDPGPQPVVGMGQPVRVDQARLRYLNSVGGEFCAVPETDEQRPRWDHLAPYLQGGTAPSAPPAAFTGIKKVFGSGGWTQEATIAIRQTLPLPLNVLLTLQHVYNPHSQP